MVTYLTWTTLKFGKHEGKTLPQAMFSDPDWVFWAHDCRIFREPQDAEAEEVAYRARNIKIPKSDPENWRIEYRFTHDDLFSGFSIIDNKSAAHPSENSKISEYLDLTVPRRMNKYDKFGNQLMLNNFREYYFNGEKLTREKCDRFFIREQNFLMSWG